MCVKESLSVAARGASMSNPRMATRLATLIVSLWIITLISADSDGEILLALKEKWQASLPTWADVDNLCKNWEGVTCQQGRVFALNLTNKGLKGPIPDGIGNLASLTSLDLSTSNWSSGPPNQITGDISVLASLTNLRTLNMTYNVLKTEFPTSLLKLTQLIALRLDNTYLTGPFPTGISNLVNLQYLYLGNCFLSGDLPSELGNLVNLVELSLWNNPFKSKLPVEISNLSKLTYLNLHNCSLWGGLPEEFGKLKSMNRLHLYTNLLTGTIPYSWKNMTNLQDLRLQYNFLTKNFPSWLLRMSNLTYLGLSYNQFYGPFPNLNNTDLKTVKLECNYFSGPFPTIVSNAALTYAGNCFSNTTAENDTSKYLCTREYSCSGFQQQLIGSCPDCPTGQTFTNVSDCICSEDGVGVPNRSKSVGIEILKIVGPILAGIFVLFVALIIFYKWWNYKRDILGLGSFFSVREINENWDVPKGVERFTLQELLRATSNFHKDHEIGVGGFGKVFFGILENGKKVAIKRASALSMQGSSEFYNEVLLLSRLHHRNLVHLEGFCEESGLQILVYEYMTKGNLQAWLFQNEAGPALDWYKRLEVAVGIAQGLEYLHSFADPPVIHRDVKPSNILLDENLVAKLADFGLSRATPEFHTHVSTTPAGTAGYIDPQYFLRRQLTTASDVYGFGVVLLEIITGQKAIDNSRLEEHNLIEWVKPKLNKDGIKGIIDPRLGSDFPEKIFLDIAWLAIGCASFNKEDRPSMKEALTILEAHLQSVAPLPEQENCQSNQGLSQHISEEKWSKSFTSPETSIGYSTASHADFEGSILLPR